MCFGGQKIKKIVTPADVSHTSSFKDVWLRFVAFIKKKNKKKLSACFSKFKSVAIRPSVRQIKK